tara:strand:+ start:5118 stop:5867 length:750 start_codon:yes stop_codon:yes gene_type:complete
MGGATAKRFVEAGARVVITDVQEQAGRTLASSLGKAAAYCRHDVSSREDWDAVIKFTQDHFGPADTLVNNAGLLQYATIADMDEADFDRLMAINVKGVFLGMQAVIAGMVAARRGCIINISSTGAMLPTNGTGAYAASKAAVEAMSRSAAMELGPHGIRVNSVHPGGINTPMTNPEGMASGEVDSLYTDIPMQRAGHPEEVANLTVFLASDEASYCTGTQFVVDGGSLAGKYHAFLPGAPATAFGGENT